MEKREGEYSAASLFFYKATCNQLAIGWSECFTRTLEEFGFNEFKAQVKLSKLIFNVWYYFFRKDFFFYRISGQ